MRRHRRLRHLAPPLPLTAPWVAHAHATELAAMSRLLDEEPALARLVQQDLEAGCATNSYTGRPGLTGEQTLRIFLVRQLTGWTYAALAFHQADSATYRTFCRLGALTAPPSKSALAATLRRVRPATLATLNNRLVTSAAARAVEPTRTVRMDATVAPMAIHPPTDSSLLLDAGRVLDRLLRQGDALVAGWNRRRRCSRTRSSWPPHHHRPRDGRVVERRVRRAVHGVHAEHRRDGGRRVRWPQGRPGVFAVIVIRYRRCSRGR